MRVLSVVGARPQFVKAALLSRELRARGVDERLAHTGQHYDERMSDVFFSELELPAPHWHLGVGSGSHADQTAHMMMRLEPIVLECDPDCVLVYGDTNSTLAGALVAAKVGVPLVHVEAGLRSFDKTMPEEVNRLVADRLADLLLAPGPSSERQLQSEGLTAPIEIVGDLMVDLALLAAERLPARPAILDRFNLQEKNYAVATIHRAANTDNTAVFARLIAGLRKVGMPILFPVHPRTRPLVEAFRVGAGDGITTCEPLSYLDMLALQLHARVVLTDSGGIQKESITLGTPCVTLRDRTEWTETLADDWNVVTGSDAAAIARAAQRAVPAARIFPFGAGDSARRIVDAMLRHIPVAQRVEPCVS